MNLLKRIGAAVLGATLALPAAAQTLVSVSGLGYHPSQEKRAIVYTTSAGGTFVVKDAANKQVLRGTLSSPKDAAGNDVLCQGEQECLVADFSALKAPGTYRVEADGESSQPFPVSRAIFLQQAPKLGEVFEAMRQQGSAYHANLHAAQNPPFPMMGDGSFVMTTHMAAVTLARIAGAYQRDPALFATDKHGRAHVPDLEEHIALHVKYLAGLQDAAGGLDVSGGYTYNFGCAPDYKPTQPRYNTQPDPCLMLDRATSLTNTLEALIGYASAIPVIRSVEGIAPAQALLDRALRTRDHVRSAYGTPSGQDAAAYGAALFMLSDITGDRQYLLEAHGLRGNVPTELDSVQTAWNEFFWQEYARHKAQIGAAGLEYLLEGQDPAQILVGKVQHDWAGGTYPVSEFGEHAYIRPDIPFNQSRGMLLGGLLAAKAMPYSTDPALKTIADAQLQWLTGMNSVQDGSDGPRPRASRSFIFGIGANYVGIGHTRLVDPTFFQRGSKFLNGATFVPGWVAGAYDSELDGDRIFNSGKTWADWTRTETTDEMVGLAMELFAYHDAGYNGRAPLSRAMR